MIPRYDAIVVGGGVAGGTAAILLAEAGWSIALVEKKAFPRRKVCGECIAAPNLALLDSLGIGSEFARIAGPPLTRVGLYVGEETLCADLPPFDGAGARWAKERPCAAVPGQASPSSPCSLRPLPAPPSTRRSCARSRRWGSCRTSAATSCSPGRSMSKLCVVTRRRARGSAKLRGHKRNSSDADADQPLSP